MRQQGEEHWPEHHRPPHISLHRFNFFLKVFISSTLYRGGFLITLDHNFIVLIFNFTNCSRFNVIGLNLLTVSLLLVALCYWRGSHLEEDLGVVLMIELTQVPLRAALRG